MGTRALQSLGHSGTQGALGHLRYSGNRTALGHSGTQGTWALGLSGPWTLGHSKSTWAIGYPGTRALEALEALEALYLADSFSTRWALGHPRHLGTWPLRPLGTRALERHLGNWVPRHSGTRGTRGTLFSRLVFHQLFQSHVENFMCL